MTWISELLYQKRRFDKNISLRYVWMVWEKNMNSNIWHSFNVILRKLINRLQVKKIQIHIISTETCAKKKNICVSFLSQYPRQDIVLPQDKYYPKIYRKRFLSFGAALLLMEYSTQFSVTQQNNINIHQIWKP